MIVTKLKYSCFQEHGITYWKASIIGKSKPCGKVFQYSSNCTDEIGTFWCASRELAQALIDFWSGKPKPKGGTYQYKLLGPPKQMELF